MMLWVAGQVCMPQTQQFQESSPTTILSLMVSCIDAFDMSSRKEKEKVFAGWRVWEASNRPWRPLHVQHDKAATSVK